MQFGYCSTNRALKLTVNDPIFLPSSLTEVDIKTIIMSRLESLQLIHAFNSKCGLHFYCGNNFFPKIPKEIRQTPLLSFNTGCPLEFRTFPLRRQKARKYTQFSEIQIGMSLSDNNVLSLGEIEYIKRKNFYRKYSNFSFVKIGCKYWFLKDLKQFPELKPIFDSRYSSMSEIIDNIEMNPAALIYSTSRFQTPDYLPDFTELEHFFESYENQFNKQYEGIVYIDSQSREAGALKAKEIFA